MARETFAARNQRAVDAGYKSYWYQRKDRQTDNYRRHLEIVKQQAKDVGRKFGNAERAAFEKRRVATWNIKSNSPTGLKARLLVQLGLRSSDERAPVGQTPTKRK